MRSKNKLRALNRNFIIYHSVLNLKAEEVNDEKPCA
jgi:hypothetical protein